MLPDLPRFHAPGITPGSSLVLSVEEAKHARVLRLKSGMRVHLVNGRGALFEASVKDAGKHFSLQVEQLIEQQERTTSPVWLAVAPTKNTARFEWMLEKCVEIGVDRVIPIACRHSERIRLNTERLVRIASSAMKQSGALWMPVVDELTSFKNIMELQASHKWMAHCNETLERRPLNALTVAEGSQLICIGPEGDFSPEEIDMAAKAGFEGLSLGTNRLRTETAAITACIAAALLHS